MAAEPQAAVLVSGWMALSPVPPPSLLVFLAAGLALYLVMRGFIQQVLWRRQEGAFLHRRSG